MSPERTLRPALLLACMLLTSGVAPAEANAGAEQPLLAGRWQLDEDRSDDARETLEDATSDVAGDLRPPRSRRPDPARLRRPVPNASLGRELFGPVRLPARRLELAVAGDAVDFRRDDQPTERIWTDGRPSVVDADNPDVRLGAWEDGVLWIERNSARGTRVLEAWRREGPDLIASFEIRNGLLEDPVTFELYFVEDLAK
ncbi:MAG: hypothetical protein V2J24_14210 [Pseudomonadales bacterium]|jgi:hypothetical protein|nr:hypothetical protein [Pseudomonadales bacterium]